MKAFVLTSCLCVLMAGKTIQTPALPPIDLEAQDYAIYSVVLNECFAKEKVQHIVIGDQTMMEFPPDGERKALAAVRWSRFVKPGFHLERSFSCP